MAADLSEALKFGAAMEALGQELNTDRHLTAVTRAAYEILSDEFNNAMHTAARANVERYHHVYEWDHVGAPGFHLWRLNLSGRGGDRRVSWSWRPSKTTVPTTHNVNGTEKFLPADGFDPERLNQIHIFTWKAPVMEYGVTVTVRPRLSHVLVFPNNQQQGAGGRMGPGVATFSPHPETITPGAQVQGNFTTFFLGFFTTQSKQILEQSFEKDRDSEFTRSFQRRMGFSRTTRMREKAFTLRPNAAAAREGKNIARAIAGDQERAYYRQAAARKRLTRSEEEA